ncbi:hypothetical protein V6N13_051428 [Hibiscus sabdariffa]
MVGRRARKRLGGAANDSITKFPISGKVPLEWLMHRSASPSPGHAQSTMSLPILADPAWQQYCPHGEHRSARPYCRRCAPGLNLPGRSSGAVTLKKLECSKKAYACIH